MASPHLADEIFFNHDDGTRVKPLKAQKVTVVGVGQVGMACAFAILSQGVAKEIVLADVMEDKLAGEVQDLQHAGAFMPARITRASADYAETAGSDVCVITAGVRQQIGETRLSLVARNLEVLRGMIPKIVKNSPDVIILVVSNPCDILTYITWKLSGLPASRVIGSGTYLDSSRFRTLLAEKVAINPQSVHAWIIGEHGDSSVPVWSGVNIAGVPMAQHLDQGEGLEWKAIHKQVVAAAYEVIKLKGYTNWAIGAAVSGLVRTILRDEQRVVPVSTLVKGCHGVDKDVCLSMPCVLGRNGVTRLLHMPLSEPEAAAFRASSEAIWTVQADLKF
eukprot:m.19540 g.19540  ORF g.19540 m.19540 type:complete len:334 (+) comp3448_c0_seq2:187-1188(+)